MYNMNLMLHIATYVDKESWLLVVKYAYTRSNTEIEGYISENIFFDFFYEGTWILLLRLINRRLNWILKHCSRYSASQLKYFLRVMELTFKIHSQAVSLADLTFHNFINRSNVTPCNYIFHRFYLSEISRENPGKSFIKNISYRTIFSAHLANTLATYENNFSTIK